MTQPRDNEGRKIPYDTLCRCGHIASEHWVSDGEGSLLLDRCRECFLDRHIKMADCLSFKRDNLRYLEKECRKRNI